MDGQVLSTRDFRLVHSHVWRAAWLFLGLQRGVGGCLYAATADGGCAEWKGLFVRRSTSRKR